MTEEMSPFPPPEIPSRQEVTDNLQAIIFACAFAVAYETLHRPAPASRITAPGGGTQPETEVEHSHRMVETAIMYAIENGLLWVPDDIAERLDAYLPVQRAAP